MKIIHSFLLINALLYNALLINSAFQTSIFSEVNNDYLGKNVIISPLSIFQVLSLTTNGAVDETQSEMVSTLKTTSLDNLNNINLRLIQSIRDFVSVELANGVMSTFDPIKNFIKICDKYNAPVEKLISVNQVNEWCSEKTHGKITEILDELDPTTVMLLLNAVYFRGEWVNPFNPKFTYNGTFYNYGKEKKIVEMMAQSHDFMYYKDRQAQVIELPYKNDSMSAVIILPNENVDLNDYIKNADDEFLNNLLNKMDRTGIYLTLPKFEVEFYSKLKKVLKRLGMVKPFTGEADFSGINGEGGLYINDVIHKTYLKVDEIGSEAAGVTIIEMRNGVITEDEMVVNRPFLFIIRSKELSENNNFLFMAKIEEL